MKRPPRMPKPMAVPSAPMPKMMPTASTVMAWMCATFSIQLSSKKPLTETCQVPPSASVMLVSHREVNDRQHREYEGLDGDDQDVKHRPDESQNELPDEAEPAAEGSEGAEPARERQHRDQEKDHLAGVEVAVETQRQRHRPREEGHRLEDEVHRHEQCLHQDVLRPEGLQRQLAHEADDALHLQAVEDDEGEHREREGEGRVEVGARHHFEMLDADGPPHPGQEVDRHQVHEIEQPHPAEDGE